MIWSMWLLACGTTAPPPAELPDRPAPAPVIPQPARVDEPEPEVRGSVREEVAIPAPEAGAGLPLGAACLEGSACGSGVCEGEGCDEASPGVCVVGERDCAQGEARFCGCDGETFSASVTCPGARFAHEGACDEQLEAEALPD